MPEGIAARIESGANSDEKRVHVLLHIIGVIIWGLLLLGLVLGDSGEISSGSVV